MSQAGSTQTGGTPALGGTGGEPTAGTSAVAGTGGEPSGGTPSLGGTGGEPTGGTPGVGGKPPVTYGEPVTLESQNVESTFVISCYPLANYGMDPTLVVDKEPCLSDILIKPSIAEIPSDALIKEATITLTCTNAGPGLGVFRPQADWSANTVTWSTRPAATASLGTIGAINEGGFVIDATSLVQAWVDGTREPFGLALRTEDTDGLIFASSRAPDVNQRPRFAVTYVVPLK